MRHRQRAPGPLTSFVLPAGSPAAAALHLARTVCRRAERAVIALADVEPVGPEAVRYLNRLSDLLFILARACNAGAGGDVLWRPGGAETLVASRGGEAAAPRGAIERGDAHAAGRVPVRG